MTIYNVGSINLDHLYHVDHFVRPGETMTSSAYECLLGGKGANQSIALAKAGAAVRHVGAIHSADKSILKQLEGLGVDVSHIQCVNSPTGHAVIQLTKDAENSIILYPGANYSLSQSQVDEVLASAEEGDWVLLQNETNLVSYITEAAHAKGLNIAFNPAPMNVEIASRVLRYLSLLIVNELEAMDLAGVDSIEEACRVLPKKHPELAMVVTLGSDGVRYFSPGENLYVPAFSVDAQDTTAAGDTFIGFALASIISGSGMREAMRLGCAASAICVTRTGAASAIPGINEVTEFLLSHSIAKGSHNGA